MLLVWCVPQRSIPYLAPPHRRRATPAATPLGCPLYDSLLPTATAFAPQTTLFHLKPTLTQRDPQHLTPELSAQLEQLWLATSAGPPGLSAQVGDSAAGV